jgi:hypothetical protein
LRRIRTFDWSDPLSRRSFRAAELLPFHVRVAHSGSWSPHVWQKENWQSEQRQSPPISLSLEPQQGQATRQSSSLPACPVWAGIDKVLSSMGDFSFMITKKPSFLPFRGWTNDK